MKTQNPGMKVVLSQSNFIGVLRRMSVTYTATLTVREREVMERVVAGQLNKRIADELGICIKTVEYHRARVMQKTGVRSVAQLVQLALQSR